MDGTAHTDSTVHTDGTGGADSGGQADAANPPARRSWRDALAWTGSGLFSGALVFTLAGLTLSVEPVADRVGVERVVAIPESAGEQWFLMLLVAVAGLVVPHTAVTAPEGEGAPSAAHRLGPTLVLAAGAVVMALLAMWSFPRDALAPASIHAHSFTETEVLLWACTVVLALAGLLAAAAGRPPRLGTGPQTLPAVAATAGVLAVSLAAGTAGSVTHPRVVHTVAADDLEDPSAALAGVHGLGWTWEPPADVRVEGVEAGPRGLVLLLSDGFIALDGATGEEQWTYRELHTEELEAQLYEGVAALTHRPENGTDREVLLDPATGELIAERPVADDLSSYVQSVSLHEYVEDTGAEGFEARELEPLGPGETLWTFAPQEPGTFCELSPGPHTPADTVTGEPLVVVSYACADSEEFKEKTLNNAGPQHTEGGLLAHGQTLDSLVVTIAALDPVTEEEVWRYDHPVTHSWSRIDLETVDRAPLAEGDAHALRFWADSELFLLDSRTGELLGHPEEARDRDGQFGMGVEEVLRADTGGTVLMLRNEYRPSDGPFDVLTTDPEGEVTARVTVDESGLGKDFFEHAVVLTDTLLIPYLDEDAWEKSVYSVPLAAGDLGGEWLEIGPAPFSHPRRDHRLLAVPGAVVSYNFPYTNRIDGLVP